MRLALIALLLLASPAAAQSVLDRAVGSYGSATDAATSCAQNPHALSFITSPPHVFLTWDQPAADATGHLRSAERYDILDLTDSTLTLRLEGPGGGAIRTLRLTPDGYCWSAPDWPLVRCEDAQLRCTAATS